MEELWDYIAESIFKAWEKSWTKLGFGLSISTSLLGLLIYVLADLDSVDLVWSLLVIFFAFVLTFVNFVVWEMQAYFPNIAVQKRNTAEGAEIVITNCEVVDLTSLEIELYKKYYVTKIAEPFSNVDPSNRFFYIDGDDKVSYGGGEKTILIGSGLGIGLPMEYIPVFQLKMKEVESFFESYDTKDHMEYDVIIKIKGKINGRSIFPRKVRGKIDYLRMPQQFNLHINGQYRIVNQIYSRMEWKDPDYGEDPLIINPLQKAIMPRDIPKKEIESLTKAKTEVKEPQKNIIKKKKKSSPKTKPS